jgi:hypothetical protein
VHPTSWSHGGQTTTVAVHHEVSLMCDDLERTMADLTAKGATFVGEPVQRGFGVGVVLQVPAAGEVLLYQPAYEPSTTL